MRASLAFALLRGWVGRTFGLEHLQGLRPCHLERTYFASVWLENSLWGGFSHPPESDLLNLKGRPQSKVGWGANLPP